MPALRRFPGVLSLFFLLGAPCLDRVLGQETTAPALKDRFGDSLPAGAFQRLGSTRFASGADSLAFFPDGDTLVSGDSHGYIRFWETKTGKEMRRPLTCDRAIINSIAVSSDGKMLAACGSDRVVRVWDAATGRALHGLEVSHADVGAVAFSPDGKKLAAGGGGDEIHVWEAKTGKELAGSTGFGERIRTLAFSPDGNSIATGGEDQTVTVWDVETLKALQRFKGNGETTCLAFSPDGRLIASGHYKQEIQLWSLDNGKERWRRKAHDNWIRCLAFAPDGKTLVSGDGNGTEPLRLWEVSTGKELRRFPVRVDGIACLAFSPDKKTLATGSSVIRVWDFDAVREIHKHAHEGRIFHLVFSPSGDAVATSGSDGTIRLWDTASGMELTHFDNESAVFALAFAPDGKILASGDYDGVVRLWRRGTAKPLRTLDGESLGAIGSLDFSLDESLLVAGGFEGIMAVWEVATGKIILRQRAQERQQDLGVRFSRDGKSLITRGRRSLSVWDARSGKKVEDLGAELELSGSLSLSLDRRTLLATEKGRSREAKLGLWRLRGKTTSIQLPVDHDGFAPFALAPDGRLLAKARAAWGRPPDICLWETCSGRTCKAFDGEGRPERIKAVAFSPDGRIVASNSLGTVLLWDVTGVRKDGKYPSERLSPEVMDQMWSDLAQPDAEQAYRAIWRLVAGGRQTVSFLAEHLRPIADVREKSAARWIADLSSDRFPVREEATRELAKLGELAEPFLTKELERAPAPEPRRRMEKILQAVRTGEMPGKTLQALRALQVLEQIATPAAQDVCRKIARGASGAMVTQEAQVLLERLAQRGVEARAD